jgi:AAA domain
LTGLESELLDRLERHPLKQDEEDLLLAAILGAAELEAAVGGTAPVRPDRATGRQPTHDGNEEGPPAGAYLRSISVSGFRGIGPESTLDLMPGPGLTVVCGRNGSGKSSFAEALEVLLTGQIRRLDDRTAVWKSTWRCLHGGPPEVSAELLLEGATGGAHVTRTWKAGDKSVTDGSVAVAGSRRARCRPGALGVGLGTQPVPAVSVPRRARGPS